MKKQLMTKTRIVQQAVLAGNAECKVLYNSAKDMVELEMGDTSLRIAATSFFMVHEMMRKAAAKLVMQTQLPTAPADAIEEGVQVDDSVKGLVTANDHLYTLHQA